MEDAIVEMFFKDAMSFHCCHPHAWLELVCRFLFIGRLDSLGSPERVMMIIAFLAFSFILTGFI